MSVHYKVKGLNRYLRDVKRTSKDTQKSVDQELARSALRVESTAKQIAPWDTGWLAMNIYSNQIAVMHYEVVSPVFYSIYLEYGTRYMAAQPFIYPALQDEYWVLMRRLNKIIRG